jgi:hypothetical protein
MMEKHNSISRTQYHFLYAVFTISGLLMLVFAKDFGWAGVALALAIVFDPNAYKPFMELSVVKRFHILGQMGMAILLIGLNLFLVVMH